jgi:hypothetical protein
MMQELVKGKKMENDDFDVNAAFVYYKEHEEKADYVCKRTPPSCPKRGDESYYVWRFDNFMERHVDCAHEPPVYYFGPLENSEIADDQKVKNEDLKIQESLKYILGLNLGLDEELLKIQKKVKEYKKNDRQMKPDISKSYGYKYCLAFGKLLYPKLSIRGQQWVKITLIFLQEYMEAGVVDMDWMSTENLFFNKKNQLSNEETKKTFYSDIELNNARFRSFAFATHPDAYIKAGIAKLPLKDLVLIASTPDFSEWMEKDTQIQAIIVAKKIIEEKLKIWTD